MDSLTALDACLAQALNDLAPAPAEVVTLSEGCGHVLAEDLVFPADAPPVAEALVAGFAVSALDLTGASPQVPVRLGQVSGVLSGDPLPPGTDAVLPGDGVETGPAGPEAIRPVAPGHGVRRAGHDGREGAVIVPAGARLQAWHALAAGLAGVERCAVRRARVAVALSDPRQAAFAAAWATALGGRLSHDAPHLILRPAAETGPRLALAPGETAWLERDGGALVLSVPRRFDGAVAALLALGVPAMSALTGARPVAEARPISRKAASALGLSDVVLLAVEDAAWRPMPPGTVTLAALAASEAFAILPPDSEGLPEGAPLPATRLLSPFG
jgi:molybdopterin biosynthesis enzyme